MPGEVTLATHGLLLASDVELFSDGVLSTLRVALQDREVRIVRAEGVYPVEALPDGTQRDCAITDSIELVPGRPLTTWYCEECHDGGRPHAASTPVP